MILVTGDTHGQIDWEKLNTRNFPFQKNMTKDDYLIILGDAGICWDGGKQDKYIQDKYNKRNFTTLFIDGNHENHDLLNSYPVETWSGGKIHRISDSIIHLMRGQVFNIDGKKIFTIGGAVSVDKKYRTKGKTWWAEEVPSKQELNEATSNLDKCDESVDYILTHSAPKRYIQDLGVNKHNKEFECDLDFYLDDIYNSVKFKKWYCGHYHIDKMVTEKFSVLYDDIIELR